MQTSGSGWLIFLKQVTASARSACGFLWKHPKEPKVLSAGTHADAMKQHRSPALLACRGGAGTRFAQTPRTFIPGSLRCLARSDGSERSKAMAKQSNKKPGFCRAFCLQCRGRGRSHG